MSGTGGERGETCLSSALLKLILPFVWELPLPPLGVIQDVGGPKNDVMEICALKGVKYLRSRKRAISLGLCSVLTGYL
jgi:hypothetical protein